MPYNIVISTKIDLVVVVAVLLLLLVCLNEDIRVSLKSALNYMSIDKSLNNLGFNFLVNKLEGRPQMWSVAQSSTVVKSSGSRITLHRSPGFIT